MKMFHFNANNFDVEFTTLAESPEEALENVKFHLKSNFDKWKKNFKTDDDDSYTILVQEEYELWKNATVDNLPNQYTIDVYESGQVLETEVS